MRTNPEAPKQHYKSLPPLDSFSWHCLTIGQFVSVLGCIGVLIGVEGQLSAVWLAADWMNAVFGIPVVQPPPDGTTLWKLLASVIVFVCGAAAFCFNVALYVVFSSVKQVRGRFGVTKLETTDPREAAPALTPGMMPPLIAFLAVVLLGLLVIACTAFWRSAG